ncbi:hypothetical protein [Methylorubrum extorquens]|uniref:hypothetical protein n=1 Tax=Methylorubrum extorquens TaxID=408 RepID=UPI001EE5BD13|nr:hypothetical protein [Methylorubrum extorquens]MCG5245307.1 hypothetical protein [Methylorubrum extorquens]
MTGLVNFSVNASENGSGAPRINLQEGKPARAVNGSTREIMAGLARRRDDNAGAYFIVAPTSPQPGSILPIAAAGSDPIWVPADGRALANDLCRAFR